MQIRLTPPPSGDTRVVNGKTIIGRPGEPVFVDPEDAIELMKADTGWTGTVPTQFGPIEKTATNSPAVLHEGYLVNPFTLLPV